MNSSCALRTNAPSGEERENRIPPISGAIPLSRSQISSSRLLARIAEISVKKSSRESQQSIDQSLRSKRSHTVRPGIDEEREMVAASKSSIEIGRVDVSWRDFVEFGGRMWETINDRTGTVAELGTTPSA